MAAFVDTEPISMPNQKPLFFVEPKSIPCFLNLILSTNASILVSNPASPLNSSHWMLAIGKSYFSLIMSRYLVIVD